MRCGSVQKYEHMENANNINNSSNLMANEDVFTGIHKDNLPINENAEEFYGNIDMISGDKIELPVSNAFNSSKIEKTRKRKKEEKQNSTAAAASNVFYCNMGHEKSFNDSRCVHKHV